MTDCFEPRRLNHRDSCLLCLLLAVFLWTGIGFAVSFLLGLLPDGESSTTPTYPTMAGTHHTILVDRALSPDQIMLLPERVRARVKEQHFLTPEPGRVIVSTATKEEAGPVIEAVRGQLQEWGCLQPPSPAPSPAPSPSGGGGTPGEGSGGGQAPSDAPENEGFDPLDGE